MAEHNGESNRPVLTGIPGFEQICDGGLPRGKITVILGGAGSGKTIFAAQTLSYGAERQGEPGLFVAFEETALQIAANTASFGWALGGGGGVDMLDANLGEELIHGGDFELSGLLAMIASKAKARGAQRVVLDGLDVLLMHLSDARLVRRETFRLREWVQRTGLTTLITAKADPRDSRSLGDYDFLQFMADCVIVLQQKLDRATAFRVLQVAKCRGRAHSANEFPFTIGAEGIDLGTSAQQEMRHEVSGDRVSSGVPALDAMLEGGYFRGTSTLITGAPGTAKTTLAMAFAEAAAARNEKTVIVSFDEAPEQIVRNMASVGIQLTPHLQAGALQIVSLRSRAANPEAHISRIRGLLEGHAAKNLIVDPLSALSLSGQDAMAEAAAVNLLDFAKSLGVTSVCTSLLGNQAPLSEETPIGISTIADTWMHVSYVNQGGERNRALTIIKSRGTGHSNQVRELILSSGGIALADVYSVGGEVLMGTLRWLKENEQRRLAEAAAREGSLREREAELRIAEAKARAQAAHAEEALCETALSRIRSERRLESDQSASEHEQLKQRRGAEAPAARATRTDP